MSTHVKVEPAPGGVWRVRVRGADQREQEYECASEDQARTLARLFEIRSRPPPASVRKTKTETEPTPSKRKLEELGRAARRLLLGEGGETAPVRPPNPSPEIPRLQVCKQNALSSPALLAASRRLGR